MMNTKAVDCGMEFRLYNIPDDLWHKFKILCVTQKKSLREKLLEMIQKEIDSFFKGKP